MFLTYRLKHISVDHWWQILVLDPTQPLKIKNRTLVLTFFSQIKNLYKASGVEYDQYYQFPTGNWWQNKEDVPATKERSVHISELGEMLGKIEARNKACQESSLSSGVVEVVFPKNTFLNWLWNIKRLKFSM